MTFFRILSIATIIIPVVLVIGMVGSGYYYRFLKKEFKLLVLYLAGCLFFDISSRAAGEFYGNNLIFMVVFSLFELLFFSVYYQTCFFQRKIWWYRIATLAGSFYIGYEIYTLISVNPEHFQTYSKTFTAFLVIIMGIDFFFKKIRNEHLDSTYTIKLNSIFIIYFSLNLIIFLPVNFLINVASS